MLKKIITLSSVLMLASCMQATNPDQESFDKMYEGSAGINEEQVNQSINNTETMPSFNQTALPEKGEQIVVMETTKGTMKIRLFPNEAPKTVENFLGLVGKQYYDGIIFHRVIPNFMIQGGDPTGTGMGGESFWGGKFEDEFNSNISNIPGSLSMANSGPNTNGSQFFINKADNSFLDYNKQPLSSKHAVFGQVFEGLDVIDAIISVNRDRSDKPLEDIKMTSVKVEIY